MEKKLKNYFMYSKFFSKTSCMTNEHTRMEAVNHGRSVTVKLCATISNPKHGGANFLCSFNCFDFTENFFLPFLNYKTLIWHNFFNCFFLSESRTQKISPRHLSFHSKFKSKREKSPKHMNYEINLPLEESNNLTSKFCIHEFTSEHQWFHDQVWVSK